MAFLARFLAFSLLSTMASALDQWGLFGCPDFRKQAVDIPYGDLPAMANYFSDLALRFPLKVIAAGESAVAAQFSCVSMTFGFTGIQLSYNKNGTQGSAALGFDTNTFQFKGMLPLGLLGVPDETKERTWTIVSDKNGTVVMKTCKGAFLSHFTSTYVMVDRTIDPKTLDMTTLVPALNKEYKINSVSKCPAW